MPLDDSTTPVADEPAVPVADEPATPAVDDEPAAADTVTPEVVEPEIVEERPEPVERIRPARRHILTLSTVAAFVLAADETTKSLVVAHLDPGSSPRILGGLLYFSLIRNSGAAWGIAGGATILFALISAIVAGAIIRVAGRLRSTPWAIALGLLLGGALGNLSDRIFREPGFLRGRVVDFVSVFAPDGRHFPIFNIADSAITTGAILLAIATLLGIGLDGSRRSVES